VSAYYSEEDFDLEVADEEDLEERLRQARIAAGIEHQCVVCGCSESRPCVGGCVWATPNLCSQCARPARDAYYGG
jgi:hypothetical protein